MDTVPYNEVNVVISPLDGDVVAVVVILYSKHCDEDNPDDPLEPDDPSVPEEPEVPEEPLEPSVPEEPLEPSVPDEPDDPSVPEEPEVPEEPDEPSVPEEPDVPDEPEVPLEPEVPEEPLDPEVPESGWNVITTFSVLEKFIVVPPVPDGFVTVNCKLVVDPPFHVNDVTVAENDLSPG